MPPAFKPVIEVASDTPSVSVSATVIVTPSESSSTVNAFSTPVIAKLSVTVTLPAVKVVTVLPSLSPSPAVTTVSIVKPFSAAVKVVPFTVAVPIVVICAVKSVVTLASSTFNAIPSSSAEIFASAVSANEVSLSVVVFVANATADSDAYSAVVP